MSRVITFSTRFPSYHPRKGEQTHFVEKILNQQGIDYQHPSHERSLFVLNDEKLISGKLKPDDLIGFIDELKWDAIGMKRHTIRAGHRWKPGDKFSPRVWSGVPYHSKQIIIAPDMEVKKVWDIEMDRLSVVIDKYKIYRWGDEKVKIYEKLAKNDGLDVVDFCHWFKYPQPFQGQIICWDENVNY